jgi:uncharacterized RDD family membrane protein YckC
MKCPKCGYLGFETSDRCRNCSYDFSLAVAVEPPPELPLRPTDTPAALADFALADDRAGAPASHRRGQHVASSPTPDTALPLFGRDEADDRPSITPPPARPPLAVRRTTPEIARGRSRPTPPRLPSIDPATDNEADYPSEKPARTADTGRPPAAEVHPAGRGARLVATLVDGVLLGLTDAAVIYLTLALAGLGTDDARLLPLVPLAAFLLILNGGYLIAFVAASGQTIGKMVTGLRVIGDDGQRVDFGGAVLRAVGCVLSLLTAGLGYLPAFVTADGRALQDRIAGTRVVSAR